jgi:ribonuclease Z
VSHRELVVLGTASQAPTRHRNHNGYLVRWDDRSILFDPGEGTQRQFTFAGVAAARTTDICITHFHGDHCLGLPGMIQRLSGDKVTREVPIYHPAAGAEFLDRLSRASEFLPVTPFRPVPIASDGVVGDLGESQLVARALDHRVPTYGYRIQEPPRRKFRPDALAEAGIAGPLVGELAQQGHIEIDGRFIEIDQVSDISPGQSLAFIMDTRICEAAIELADGADLVVCESTFLESEAHLAHDYGHLTAAEAARIAKEAGARSLVLTHFSARYSDTTAFVVEAERTFPSVVAVADFDRVPVPARR